jgi:hypothetical protein
MIPPIPYNFYAASIEKIDFGPRPELSLQIQLWNQLDKWPWVEFDKEGPNITVRFGGVKNLAEVKAFFDGYSDIWLEFHYLRYSQTDRPKASNLYVELGFDRIDTTLTVHCKSLTIDDIYHSWDWSR